MIGKNTTPLKVMPCIQQIQITKDEIESINVAPKTVAPVIFSYLRLLVRTRSNQEPVRKVLESRIDLLLFFFIFPSSSP
jgi:hypothetical protein